VTIASETREIVFRRAQGVCEYCRLPQDASVLPHQIDHIIGRQHHGTDEAVNLCLCCLRCNSKKGPNIASIDPETGAVVPLYHPRYSVWREHFALGADGNITGRTPEGRATVRLLEMNDRERLRLRTLLMRRGRYP
jgi:hypothetical protein